MRIRNSILIFLFLGFSNAKSQYLDISWPFGYDQNRRASLNFSSGSLVIDTFSSDMKLSSCIASISDSSGKIITLTNGCYVSNSLNDTMLNGANLNPSSCNSSYCGWGGIIAQGNLILPNPANSHQFVLFHETCDFSNGGNPISLYTSIVDFSLDSGKGGIVNKNNIIYSGPLCYGNLSAVKHANGRDWWILLHKRFTDESLVFLLDTAGLAGPIIQSIGPIFDSVGYGISCFSPDGNWYCTTTLLGDIHLWNFDRCEGILSNYQYVDIADSNGSTVSFSPSSNFLYINTSAHIYQYDVNNITNNPFLVANYDGFLDTLGQPTGFGFPQLMTDGKIYLSAGSRFFHVVNSPDSFGFAADVQQHSIQLPCVNQGTVPSLPNYRLGPLSIAVCDSLNSIGELTKENIILSPNPCTDILKIKLSTQGGHSQKLKIYNSLGQKMIQQKLNAESDEWTIDTSHFPKGVYFISVEGDFSLGRRSFVKI